MLWSLWKTTFVIKLLINNLKKTLSMFCDENGFLRSHSQIINADKPFDSHFPVIFQNPIPVEVLVRKVHYDIDHFGWSYLLAKIQERFWILHGQSSVRSYQKIVFSVNFVVLSLVCSLWQRYLRKGLFRVCGPSL